MLIAMEVINQSANADRQEINQLSNADLFYETLCGAFSLVASANKSKNYKKKHVKPSATKSEIHSDKNYMNLLGSIFLFSV